MGVIVDSGLDIEPLLELLAGFCLVDVDEEVHREQAVTYGLEDEIDLLLRYLEKHGEVDDDRFPEWDEFQGLAVDYEIQLS